MLMSRQTARVGRTLGVERSRRDEGWRGASAEIAVCVRLGRTHPSLASVARLRIDDNDAMMRPPVESRWLACVALLLPGVAAAAHVASSLQRVSGVSVTTGPSPGADARPRTAAAERQIQGSTRGRSLQQLPGEWDAKCPRHTCTQCCVLVRWRLLMVAHTLETQGPGTRPACNPTEGHR